MQRAFLCKRISLFVSFIVFFSITCPHDYYIFFKNTLFTIKPLSERGKTYFKQRDAALEEPRIVF